MVTFTLALSVTRSGSIGCKINQFHSIWRGSKSVVSFLLLAVMNVVRVRVIFLGVGYDVG